MTLFKQTQPQKEVIRVICEKCLIKTNHRILQAIEKKHSKPINPDNDFYGFFEWLDRYQIIQCQACENISFRHLSWFSEYQDEHNDGTTEYLYPQQSKNALTDRDFPNIPEILQRIYKETIDAYNFNAFTLCAGGLRALVEGICADKEIKGIYVEKAGNDGIVKKKLKSDLEGKIIGLYEHGILTKPNADILHEHRYLGNQALHKLEKPSKAELTLAIEIIEHTLENLYEMPKKAENLKRSRNKRQTLT